METSNNGPRVHTIRPHMLASRVRVAVIGAGGTGSQILTGLAQLHTALLALGHPGGLDVTVIDDDQVSKANVGRQMFYPADIGQYKASVLVNRINLTMGTHWRADTSRVHDHSVLDHHLVIGCVDSRAARAAILNAMQGRQRNDPQYLLDLGNRLSDGQVVLGEVYQKPNWVKKNPYPDRLPHVGDLFPEIIDAKQDGGDDAPSCSLAEALEKQSLFVNRSVAVYALNLLWELFRHGQIAYHGVFVNIKSARTSPLPIDEKAWARFGYKPTKPRAPRKTGKARQKEAVAA